jgi:hypothetical protein
MNNRYLYQVGDSVRLHEKQEIVGVITQLCSMDESEPSDDLNPDYPYYHIEWDDPKLGKFIGFEYESSLVPEYVNPRPNMFIRKVYDKDVDMWGDILNEINDELS